MARYLSDLFIVRPETFGARGDPYFWEYLENYFSKIEFPYSEIWFTDDIERLFIEITGEHLSKDANPYVEAFAHGGMSSGVLCGAFWVEKAIPLLVKRYRMKQAHVCPICGKFMFDEVDSYDICDICGWEDNSVQEMHPDKDYGPNGYSLNEYKSLYENGKLDFQLMGFTRYDESIEDAEE